ncbi:MAG TPA: hypothetical protein VIK33_19480 [Anaerolineae bacterium]
MELASNNLPKTSEWLFPEYDFAAMNPDEYAGVVIERILNRGSWAEIQWLLNRYGKHAVAKWVRQRGYRRLDRRAFEYWRWMLGIKRYKVPPWEPKLPMRRK